MYFLLFKVLLFFFSHGVNLVLMTFSVFKSAAYRVTALAKSLLCNPRIAWNSLEQPGTAWNSPAEDKTKLHTVPPVKLRLSLLI